MSNSRTHSSEIRSLRSLCGIGPEGEKRDPRSHSELRQFCLALRDWLGRDREAILDSTPLGRRVLATRDDFTPQIRVVWEHVRKIAGNRSYPCSEPGPYPIDRAEAALDRVVEWCNTQTPSLQIPTVQVANGVAANQGTWKSVTELDFPLASCGPLPPDLLAAFNLAVNSAGNAKQILNPSRMFLDAQSSDEDAKNFVGIVVNCIEGIRNEYPYHHVLNPVENLLTSVSEPQSRFGAPNAHRAALDFARAVLNYVWSVADQLRYSQCPGDPNLRMDVSLVPKRFRSIAERLGTREWPEADTIIQACQVEAAKAAEARRLADASARLPGANAAPTIVGKAKGQQGSSSGGERKVAAQPVKGKRISERMVKGFQDNPDRIGWGVRQWAVFLECSISTVQESNAWQTILTARALEAADAVSKRKQKGRRSSGD
jgi:hypothetical protein